MKRVLFASLICIGLFACSKKQEETTQIHQIYNPILAGFYPDPGICAVGDNFYLVTSTFSFYPGLPIFQSKDLSTWNQIGHVLDRPEQLNLEGQRISQGLYAPTISFHGGLFYVVCTNMRGGNFVVTAEDPAGPWSNPSWLKTVNGIDPSLYFEGDNAYIVYNSVAPDNKPLYSGHRTIRMQMFDKDSLKAYGEEMILVNGGVDISKEPEWIEAPHVYKINGTYYLSCAEGGTAEDHSQVVFRSDSVTGPYIPYENNPILTQRHLDPKRPNPITTTGHADFVQTKDGDWWAVFLGCRPYENDLYSTGRETFIAPIKWTDGWPVINPDFEEVQFSYPLPMEPSGETVNIPLNGNFTYKDDFNSDKLKFNWIFIRTPQETWYSLTDEPGTLKMQLRPETCSGRSNPSFIGHRQQHHKGSVATKLTFSPADANEKAGMTAFLNENRFYFLCKSIEDGKEVVQLYKSTPDTATTYQMELLASKELKNSAADIYFKIESNNKVYNFFFAEEQDKWELLKDNVDAEFLAVDIPKDFTGVIYGLYASSFGKESETTVSYDWFDYVGNDDIYNEK